jgi:hypothetical protein
MTEGVSVLRLHMLRGMRLLNLVLVGSGVCNLFSIIENPHFKLADVR